MSSITCPKCGAEVEYHRTNCERGHFIGFPNVRRAEEMRADLVLHYNDAISDASRRGTAIQIKQLESVLQSTVATINIDAKLLRNMASSQNYTSYYKALELSLRKIAARTYHGDREAVDAKVHTGYGTDILNAALSPTGNGLTNYGPITLILQDAAIEDRASVLRENAFDFYERYDLGRRGAVEQFGWRSTWNDRALLGVAHLASEITPATGAGDIAPIVLSSGTGRHDDRYIEVHIYGELSWQSLSKVTLEKPLTDPDDRDDWDFGRQKLGSRGVTIVDRFSP